MQSVKTELNKRHLIKKKKSPCSEGQGFKKVPRYLDRHGDTTNSIYINIIFMNKESRLPKCFL
jgi:hypothetical protein